MMTLANARAAERVLKRISVDANGCWNFLGRTDRDGYGLQWVGPKPTRKLRFTHRITYQHIVGEIPVGLELDHLCRNRGCCNPAHLEPVTTQENTRRGVKAQTECINGHKYTESNTYRTPKGHRACRTCHNDACARYRARRAA